MSALNSYAVNIDGHLSVSATTCTSQRHTNYCRSMHFLTVFSLYIHTLYKHFQELFEVYVNHMMAPNYEAPLTQILVTGSALSIWAVSAIPEQRYASFSVTADANQIMMLQPVEKRICITQRTYWKHCTPR